MAEADVKRALTLEAAEAAGRSAVVASSPATVRWLLCGRGRPVSSASPAAAYTVVLLDGKAYALFQDIEASRVAAEERLEELGYEPVSYAWHEPPDGRIAELVAARPALAGEDLEQAVAPARRRLQDGELERYRAAGAAAAEAMVETIRRLAPENSEAEAAARLAFEARRHGFTTPVVLVAGDERQPLHRHPLPTDAPLGRHALLAITAEREGLYVSLTRLVSFGPPPARLAELVRAVAQVDADILRASQAGKTLGEVFLVLERAYAAQGFPEEWRHHHQGGLTGYAGREVFAVPGDPTIMPRACAAAWNPSIAGGAKSEDTVLVTENGVEVITRTPTLPELDVDGIARPGIAEL